MELFGGRRGEGRNEAVRGEGAKMKLFGRGERKALRTGGAEEKLFGGETKA